MCAVASITSRTNPSYISPSLYPEYYQGDTNNMPNFYINPSSSSSSITYPAMGTVSDWYSQIASYLPTSTTIDASKYGTLEGLGQDYWDTLTTQATAPLEKQYFSNDASLMNQFKDTMGQRGLYGSGIEAGGITDVYSQYGDALSNILASISTQKAEKDYETAEKNREFALDIDKSNIQNQLALSELGLGGAMDYGRAATDYDLGLFETQADLEKTKAGTFENFISTLSQLASDPNIGDDNRNEILKSILSQYASMYDPTFAS